MSNASEQVKDKAGGLIVQRNRLISNEELSNLGSEYSDFDV